MNTPVRKITQKDKQNADRLNSLWQRKRKSLDLTQVIISKKLGISQPAFSQYLSCSIVLNIDMILKISHLLKVHPSEIDPDLDTGFLLVESATRILKLPVLFSTSKKMGEVMGTVVEVEFVESKKQAAPIYAVYVAEDVIVDRPNEKVGKGIFLEGSYLNISPTSKLKRGDVAWITLTNGERFIGAVASNTMNSLTLHNISYPNDMIFTAHKIVSVQLP